MTNQHNTISRKSSAAEALIRTVKTRQSTPRNPDAIEGDFAQAVARKLESRGIATVPGLPTDEPGPHWYDAAIEVERRHREFEAQREAGRQAEEAAKNAPQTAAGMLSAAIAGQAKAGGPVPLNGAAVLGAALAGGKGTINGGG
ncbi:hypothetical protein [Mycolicibacterium hippocampi]|uniref:hypothetical protein n=1 Tax=Mycolicibacterium hippocampi TaxID=659824 RepID=UPI0035190A07